jgi:hypothetical protein
MTPRVALGCRIVFAALLPLGPICSLGQLAQSGYESFFKPPRNCSTTEKTALSNLHSFETSTSTERIADDGNINAPRSDAAALEDAPSPASSQPDKQSFRWRRALTESFTFLVIEQAYVVHTDFRWVVSENGIPFNHYWRDYMQSLTSWWHAGWSAGENPLYNYLGHPIQGAMTSFIAINNDPKYEDLEYSNTKAYWRSRLRATIWNAVYSTQWSIGLLSEPTVEKYGSKDRPPWNANGSYPCNTNTCYSGVGKVNLVMTPVGGLGWVLAEDILDKKVAEPMETRTHNRLLINTVRSATNPIRGGANILHGNRPWYRARDGQRISFRSDQKTMALTNETPQAPLPNHGNIFLGYTHLGPSHCEVIYSATYTACDPLSSVSSNLGGWNTSVEKMYLRYFGAVADFSGQYGGVGQNNFLFGIRGGSWVGRLRPYANALFGAVREHGNTSAGFMSDTTFAEDLGLGIDFRFMRRLSWRSQIDELKTGSTDFKRYNVRASSGVAMRF